MSTRSVITFIDDFGSNSVYKHHDGYPSGMLKAIEAAIPYAWPLPRFEADDFAAAFVRGNKQGGGYIRLTSGHKAHGDLEHYYEVTFKNDELLVQQFDYGPDEELFSVFCGTLEGFRKHVQELEAA